MASVAGFFSKVERLRAQRLDIFAAALKDSAPERIALTRVTMLRGWAGLQKIGTYKRQHYALMKYRHYSKVAGLGNVDLRLSGAFYRDLYMKIGRRSFAVGSQDFKAPFLEKRYGVRIYDLSREEWRRWLPQYFKNLKKRVISQL